MLYYTAKSTARVTVQRRMVIGGQAEGRVRSAWGMSLQILKGLAETPKIGEIKLAVAGVRQMSLGWWMMRTFGGFWGPAFMGWGKGGC